MMLYGPFLYFYYLILYLLGPSSDSHKLTNLTKSKGCQLVCFSCKMWISHAQKQEPANNICTGSSHRIFSTSKKQHWLQSLELFDTNSQLFAPSSITHHAGIGDENQLQVLTAGQQKLEQAPNSSAQEVFVFWAKLLGKNTALLLLHTWSSHLWGAALPGPRPSQLLWFPQSRSVQRRSPWDHFPSRLQCSTGCLPWHYSLKYNISHTSSYHVFLFWKSI